MNEFFGHQHGNGDISGVCGLNLMKPFSTETLDYPCSNHNGITKERYVLDIQIYDSHLFSSQLAVMLL